MSIGALATRTLAPATTAPPAIAITRAKTPGHARRLSLLLLAIVLMSAADLLCTLIYMSTVGLIEANPIARLMVSIGGAKQLVMFKLLTTVICCGALHFARRHPLSEKVAWICVAMLLGLMIHWTMFNSSISALTNEITILALHGGHEWWTVTD